MSKRNSTTTPNEGKTKPERPPGFPLFAHATKRWAKKIRGRMHYFGPWDDPDGAHKSYLDQKDSLHSGQTPRPEDEGLTVYILCGKFLQTKKKMLEAGELSVHSFADYTRVSKLLLKTFHRNRLVADLRPDDFEKLRAGMAKRLGPVKLGNEINRIRVIFNYAYKNGLIDKPMVYGEGFKRPSKKTLRKHRAEQGPKMFEAEEIRRMIEAAGQPLKTMILLGVNCGYGNSDVGNLPLSALDLDRGFTNYARAKTGIGRKCFLWAETIDALKEWLAIRSAPRDPKHAGLVFITAKGDTWAKETSDNPVSKETAKLMKSLSLNGHRNFYCLRHTLQTIGDEARDFLAVRHVMGHVSNDVADEYRERVSDDRLRAVAEHMRGWLFGRKDKGKPSKTQDKAPRAGLRLFAG